MNIELYLQVLFHQLDLQLELITTSMFCLFKFTNRSPKPLISQGQIDTETLPQFNFFPKLPPEVQLRVWELAVVPRIITIWSLLGIEIQSKA